LDAFHITFYLFGLLLLYTAYRLARHEGQEIDPEHNPALRLIRRRVPMTESYDHGRFVTRHAGRRIATPLLAVFVVVATTDVIFAVDSIPAIFAVTREPFVVFAANMRILVGVDGSPRSDDALALAVLLSRALDAELLLSRVHPPKRLRPPLRTRKPHRPINRAADTALRTPRVHPQVRSELQVSMLADTLRQSTSGD
jgi:hypothetical protein